MAGEALFAIETGLLLTDSQGTENGGHRSLCYNQLSLKSMATPATAKSNEKNGSTPNNRGKPNKRHLTNSKENGPDSKRLSVSTSAISSIANNFAHATEDDISDNSKPTHDDLINAVQLLAQDRLSLTKRMEIVERQQNNFTIRIDGIPKTAEDPYKTVMEIIQTCLLLPDVKQEDFSIVKFVQAPKNAEGKSMIATFIRDDIKKKLLASCLNLSKNKLNGIHEIRIQPQLTKQQVNEKSAALVTKRACQLYAKSIPGFFATENTGNHLKVVGYNLLDEPTKKKNARHFTWWIRKLIDSNKKQPLEDAKFIAELENACKMANQLDLKID
ncbi:hypothetical protein Ddc_08388 [Ditylenchus destructor]|nr:hypothetical protein Ddc_08388 [Ditylenchus destructor]